MSAVAYDTTYVQPRLHNRSLTGIIGTGGNIPDVSRGTGADRPYWLHGLVTTALRALTVVKPNQMALVRDSAAIVQHAQLVLGLTMKDLAAVFQVSRQTLYSRIKEGDAAAAHNSARFNDIEKVVIEIEKVMTVVPGASAKSFTVEGTTLFELLCADKLDANKIIHIARAIESELQNRSSQLKDSSNAELKESLSRFAPSA
jgi:hypothetical protein